MQRPILSLLLFVSLALPVSVSAAVLQAPLGTKNVNQSGLVGYWSFNGKDMNGNTAYDRSGQGNNGTLGSSPKTPTRTPGKVGQGLVFDGTDDYVSAGSAASLDNVAQKTVAFWIRRANTNYSLGTPIGKTSWAVEARGTSNLQFRHWFDGTYGTWAMHGPIPTDEWVNITVSYDRSSTSNVPTFYINGVATTTDVIGNPTGSPTSDAGPDLILGALDTFGTNATKGIIDEVRIYNRILTPAEVKALYRLGQGKHKVGPSQNGLVGWWKFDEGLGTQADDSSGQRNHGTLTNTPTWAGGKLGSAVDFVNGSNQYVNAGSGDSIDDLVEITVSAWIKPRSIGQNSLGRIVGKNRWKLQMMSPNKIGFARDFDVTNGTWSTDSNSVRMDEWTHVVVTYNNSLATNDPAFYLNGVATATTEFGTPSDIPIFESPNPLYVGNEDAGGYTRDFDGLIDDVRVYNRILTATEVRALYDAKQATVGRTQSSLIPNGLVGYWSMNGKDFTDKVYDRSGQNNHGYFIGGATSSAKVIGKVGQGARFDGIDDIISADGTSFDDLSAITVSAWIYAQSHGENAAGHIVNKGTGSNGAANGWLFRLSTQFLDFQVGYSGGTTNVRRYATAFTSDKLREWHHVAATWSGDSASSSIRLFLDGTDITVETIGSGQDALFGRDSDTTTPLKIGNSNSFSRTFDGTIDEVRVYNRILTPAEIKQLYGAGR